MIRAPLFNVDDAQRAYDTWRANCGPGALAAILHKKIDDVRALIPLFDERHYTNPTMMYGALKAARASWRKTTLVWGSWPEHGLVRIQWEGPWTEPGVPIAARYRHTHWVGSRRHPDNKLEIFDINEMCVGGWIPFDEWKDSLVPWLLKEIGLKKAYGTWHPTHQIEVDP